MGSGRGDAYGFKVLEVLELFVLGFDGIGVLGRRVCRVLRRASRFRIYGFRAEGLRSMVWTIEVGQVFGTCWLTLNPIP